MTRLGMLHTRHRRRALSVAGQAGRRVRFPPGGNLRPADLKRIGINPAALTQPWTVPPDLDAPSLSDMERFAKLVAGLNGYAAAHNSPNLSGEGALAHRLSEQESRRPLKTRGLLLKFIRSLHPASFHRKP